MQQYTKLAKFLLFVSVILLVPTAVFTILSINHELAYELSSRQDLDRNETAIKYLGAAVFWGFFSGAFFLGASHENNECANNFKKVFAFDPRDKLHLIGGNPQEYVSAEIARRRLEVLEIFREEVCLRQNKETPQPVMLYKKVSRKKSFWYACEIARTWGFKTPSSIKESLPKECYAYYGYDDTKVL